MFVIVNGNTKCEYPTTLRRYVADQTVIRYYGRKFHISYKATFSPAQIQFVWIVTAAAVNVHWNKNMALFVSSDPTIRQRVEKIPRLNAIHILGDSYEIILCRQSDRAARGSRKTAKPSAKLRNLLKNLTSGIPLLELLIFNTLILKVTYHYFSNSCLFGNWIKLARYILWITSSRKSNKLSNCELSSFVPAHKTFTQRN